MKYATSFVTAAVLVLSGSGVSGIVLPPGATPVHPPDGIEILKERIVLPPGATPIRHPDGTEVLKKRIVLPPGATPVRVPDGTEILKERELLRPGETVIHPPPGAVIARQAELLDASLFSLPPPSLPTEDPHIIYGRRIPEGVADATPIPIPASDFIDKRMIPEAATAHQIYPGLTYEVPPVATPVLNANDKRRIPAAIPTSFQTVPVALPSDEPIIPLKPGFNTPIAGKKREAIGFDETTGESFEQMAQQQEQQQQQQQEQQKQNPQQRSPSILIPDLPGEPKTALKRRSGSIELPSEIVPDLPGEPKAALKQRRYVLPSGATAAPIPHPSGLHIVALTGQDGAQQ